MQKQKAPEGAFRSGALRTAGLNSLRKHRQQQSAPNDDAERRAQIVNVVSAAFLGDVHDVSLLIYMLFCASCGALGLSGGVTRSNNWLAVFFFSLLFL